MTQPFHFNQFTIQQKINPQKVGTDSMLLGAWSCGTYNFILDIGTGTGILALMLAQQNPTSKIIAIEPDEDSINEAIVNFTGSRFNQQIIAIKSSLQDFKMNEKFDLIISNPPYFENSFLSESNDKNRARHTNSLPINIFYEKAKEFLKENGNLNLILPFDLESIHLREAEKYGFYPEKIIRTKRENGEYKRTLISYSLAKKSYSEKEMIVKYSDNSYSKEYIEMTKDFYKKKL